MSFRLSYREPVSKDEAEDYLDIISQPMDFQTMLGKFGQGSYRHCQDFMEDVKLVFSNAEEYNHEGSNVLSCMVKTEQTFVELLQKLLPGLAYLRRRSRKRVRHPPSTSSEEDEEEEPKKLQNGKSKRRSVRIRQNCRDEESEDEDEAEAECDAGRRRRSKRTAATSGKDYREQNSDGECDTRGRRRKGGSKAPAESSDEEGRGHQRSSKRRKH